jgi:putative nucleotidyltransferase with HDIG domain
MTAPATALTAAQQREQLVAGAIKEISHIATLPEITLKIVELVENPKSTAQDLHKVISNDPALCTRILKVVNSSFYGLPGQIGSINRAIVMLGLNAVKNIAIAASLAKLFRGADIGGAFSARKLWEHSISVGATTKLLADRLKIGLGDEAFLAGLMHDIGLMVEMQFDRNKLVEAVRLVGAGSDGIPCNSLLDAEEQTFGADHQAFGAALCDRWKFPRNFVLVTGHHHRPLDLPAESRTLPSLVFVADRLTAELAGGYRLDLVNLDIDAAVLDGLKLGSEKLAEVRQALPEHLKSVAGLLG